MLVHGPCVFRSIRIRRVRRPMIGHNHHISLWLVVSFYDKPNKPIARDMGLFGDSQKKTKRALFGGSAAMLVNVSIQKHSPNTKL